MTKPGGNPLRSNAVSPGIKDFAAVPTNFVDTDIAAPTPISMACTGFSDIIASSREKEIALPNVSTTCAIDIQSEQSAHYNIVTNFALGIVLSNVCHQHLNTTVLGNFPIKVDVLDMQLAAHPDRSKVKFVTDGLPTGFCTGFHADKINLKSAETNCSSVIAHPNVIDKYLADEIDARRVAGPFEVPPFLNLHVSRFGVIPKKNKSDAWRLILDLSSPTDHSVNDGIFKNEFPVVYSTVRDAINLIVQTGKGALVSKVDIQKAYRIVPIHPGDRYLLGMKWWEKFFVDLALPFGLRSTPGIFNSLADLFEWTLRHNYHVPNLLHYLDDFFTLGPADSMVCSNLLNAIQQASLNIGIPLAREKCEGPTTCITLLGIELNSIDMTARLPNDKLAELQTLIGSWTGKKFCTCKELESLVGKLNHACAVVAPGRTFLQRLINLLRVSKPRQKFIRLTKQARLDLQ